MVGPNFFFKYDMLEMAYRCNENFIQNSYKVIDFEEALRKIRK